MRKYLFLILIQFLISELSGQTTFWSEDFNGYADGVTVGANNNTVNAALDWTMGGCTTCPSSSSDWWEIRNGLIEARDVNNELVQLTTESIDISSYVSVNFSVVASEAGDLEGYYLNSDNCTDQANEDFADIEYRIDGGAWQLVSNYNAWCGLYASCAGHTLYGDDGTGGDCRVTDADWGSTTVTVSALTGSTLEIRLSCTNSSGSEYIRFDDIIVEYNAGGLPVTLTSFEANYNGSNVDLSWQTSAELNNDFYTIERSIDGFNFEIIAYQEGAGNSNSILNYKYVDYSPVKGVSYYRLKQTDFDGKFEYFDVKSVKIESSNETKLLVYPNPFSNQIIVEGTALELEKISIYDMYGHDVTKQLKIQKQSDTKLLLNTNSLESGMYSVRAASLSKLILKK